MNEVRTKIVLEGTDKVKVDLKEISKLQEELAKKGAASGSYSDLLRGVNPKTIASNPALLAELQRLTKALTEPSLKTSPILDKGLQARTDALVAEMKKWGSIDNLQRKYPQAQGNGINLSSNQPQKGSSKFNFLDPLNLGGKAGQLFGALARVQIALWELRPIIDSVRFVFARLAKAVQDATNVYIKAAQLGRAPGDLFLAQKAAAVSGMSEEQLQAFLLKLSRNGAPGVHNDSNFSARASMFGLQKEAMEMVASLAHLRESMNDVTGKLYNIDFASVRLGAELQVLWSQLTAGASGAIKNLIDTFADFISVLNELKITQDIGRELGAVLVVVNKTLGLLLIGLGELALGFKFIGATISSWLVIVNNAFADVFPKLSKRLGISKIEGKGVFDAIWGDVNKGAEALKKSAKRWLEEGWSPEDAGRTGNRIPLTPAMTLPAGQWEKLGLSFGAGGSTDSQIAANTKRSADMLERIYGVLPAALNNNPIYNQVNLA